MRKPSRNGNPGGLQSRAAHQLARHFLKCRWRNPDDADDFKVIEPFFKGMDTSQVDLCVSVLREFRQWHPGPAGRNRDQSLNGPMAQQGQQVFSTSASKVHNVKRGLDQVDSIPIRDSIADSSRSSLIHHNYQWQCQWNVDQLTARTSQESASHHQAPAAQSRQAPLPRDIAAYLTLQEHYVVTSSFSLHGPID